MSLRINTFAIVNDYCRSEYKLREGERVFILDKSGDHNFRVEFDDGKVVTIKDEELNEMTDEDKNYMDYISTGYIVNIKNEIAKIIKTDYLHQIAEVKFDDKSYATVSFDVITPIDNNKISKPIRIALIGKMRTGKDTLASYIVNEYKFKKYAFGDELKRYFHELFGETETKPREGYQWFGQTMRERDPEIWVRKCFERIHNDCSDKVIITDLRQPNEYNKCKEEGFIIIKVESDDIVRLKRIINNHDNFKIDDLFHETERYADKFGYDYLISNNGSLSELYLQLDMIMSELNN